MGMREKTTPMHFECARMPVARRGRRFHILNQFPIGWIQVKTPDFRVVRGSGMTERTASLEGHPSDGEEGGDGIIERYRRGEVDLHTVLANMPESGVPPYILAAYNAMIAPTAGPDAPQEREKKQRDEAYERFVDLVEQWRVDRGFGYVEAYLELKRTGTAIDEGQRVFESDWFRVLQDTRAKTIRELEAKAKSGGLAPHENETLAKTQREFEGDKRVSQNWQSLADDYRAILAREETRGMTEEEIREAEAAARQKIFEELDSASPELRETLLAEMAQHDPSIRKEYHAHHLAKVAALDPVLPDTGPVSDELAAASASSDLDAGLFDDDLLAGGIKASAAPTQDFNRAAHQRAAPDLAGTEQHVAALPAPTRRSPSL